MVRYLARLARSTSAMEPMTSGAERTSTGSPRRPPGAVSRRQANRRGWGPRRHDRRTRCRPRPGDRLGGAPRGRAAGRPSPRRLRRPSATFDLVAQLDQRELAAGDLVGQPAAVLWVLDLQQLVGMGQGVFAHRHQLRGSRWAHRRAGAGSRRSPCPCPVSRPAGGCCSRARGSSGRTSPLRRAGRGPRAGGSR